MQPENSRSNVPGIEQLPMPPSGGQETIPVLPPLVNGLERGQERFEQAGEANARLSDATSMTSIATTSPTPTLQPITNATPTPAATVTSPLVAADEDLIEKEWVDKAKTIIEQTKDDPHSRTKQVNDLQRDYLQKRYGKIVGSSE